MFVFVSDFKEDLIFNKPVTLISKTSVSYVCKYNVFNQVYSFWHFTVCA
jgi:hypothetical protein